MLLRAIWSPDRWRVRGLERSDRCNKCNRWYKCNILPITPISLIPPITLILFHGTRTAQPKQGDLWKLKSFSPCNAIYGEAEYLWKINILYSATPLLSESALRRAIAAAKRLLFFLCYARGVYSQTHKHKKKTILWKESPAIACADNA